MCLTGLEPATYRLKADYATNCITDTKNRVVFDWFFLNFGYSHILRFCYKHQIGLVNQNENNGVAQTSERTI